MIAVELLRLEKVGTRQTEESWEPRPFKRP
jgi:hypothetical protein